MTPQGAAADHPRVRTWMEIRAPLERQLAPLGRAAMTALRLQPGDHVLDIGCGVGRTPIDLARAVGPTGRVLAFDLLDLALDIVRQDPDLPGTVAFACGDAQSYPFPPGAFDAVFSRFGVMFFPDPEPAFANLRRALRRGGRLGFVCWRGLAENELDHLPLQAAAPHLSPDLVANAATSQWFAFEDAIRTRAVLTAAGFTDIQITAHDEHVTAGSLQETVDVCTRAGALGTILREHPELVPAATAALERTLASRDSRDGPTLCAAAWVVTARG